MNKKNKWVNDNNSNNNNAQDFFGNGGLLLDGDFKGKSECIGF